MYHFYFPPCVSLPSQRPFDSDNLWPVITFTIIIATLSIHWSIPTRLSPVLSSRLWSTNLRFKVPSSSLGRTLVYLSVPFSGVLGQTFGDAGTTFPMTFEDPLSPGIYVLFLSPTGCLSTLRSSLQAFLPYPLALHQIRLRYAPSRRCGVSVWVVTSLSTLLSFWVCRLS
jgi:hypothetical protein